MIAHKTSRARKDAAAVVASDGRNKAVKVITTGGASELASLLIRGRRAGNKALHLVSEHCASAYLTLDRVLYLVFGVFNVTGLSVCLVLKGSYGFIKTGW